MLAFKPSWEVGLDAPLAMAASVGASVTTSAPERVGAVAPTTAPTVPASTRESSSDVRPVVAREKTEPKPARASRPSVPVVNSRALDDLEPQKKQRKNGILYGIIAAAFVVLAGVGVVAFGSNNSSTETPGTSPTTEPSALTPPAPATVVHNTQTPTQILPIAPPPAPVAVHAPEVARVAPAHVAVPVAVAAPEPAAVAPRRVERPQPRVQRPERPVAPPATQHRPVAPRRGVGTGFVTDNPY
jgi:hypothetical protein